MKKPVVSSGQPWVTVAIFDFPHEIMLLRSRLEADNIPHFFKDEFVAQTSYALAVGGIKLQVPEDRIDEVHGIFQEVGLSDKLPQNPTPDIFDIISSQAAYIPLLRRLPGELRWLVLVALFTAPAVLLLYYFIDHFL